MELAFNDTGYPETDQFSEEGFVDFVMKIDKITEGPDGYLTLECRADFRKKRVGLFVMIAPDMKEGFDGKDIVRDAFVNRGIVFKSLGSESDELVRAIAQLYGIDAKRRFAESIPFTTIALNGNPQKMKTENVRFKLFGNDQGGEEEYFESFFHVNLPGKFVCWNEKDQEYRVPLLNGIQENSTTQPAAAVVGDRYRVSEY